MIKVPRWLKLGLKIIATGTYTMLLSACYGVVQAMYGPPAGYRDGTLWVKDDGGTPLPGIKVSFQESASLTPDAAAWALLGRTDTLGKLRWNMVVDKEYLHALIQDTDGAANGGEFADASAIVNDDLEVVVLHPKTGN